METLIQATEECPKANTIGPWGNNWGVFGRKKRGAKEDSRMWGGAGNNICTVSILKP